MKIQIFGSGCTTCKKLYELTQKVAIQLGVKEKVEYITDVSKIVELGVMSSPVLVVNDKPVMVGFIPDEEKIKNAILSGNVTTKNAGNCSCDSTC